MMYDKKCLKLITFNLYNIYLYFSEIHDDKGISFLINIIFDCLWQTCSSYLRVYFDLIDIWMNMWNLFSNYIKYIIYNIIWIHQFIKSIVIFHIYLMLLQILCDFLTCFSERLSFSTRKYVLKINQVLNLHILEFKT